MRLNADWTDREKVMVYGGLALVLALFAIIFVFGQFFVVEDRFHLSDLWKSGVSSFTIARAFLPLLYVVIVLPGAFIGAAVYGFLKKNAFRWRNVLILLFFPAEGILLSMAMLTVFDLWLSDLQILVQAPLIALAVSVSLVVVALTLRTRRVHDYVKQSFD